MLTKELLDANPVHMFDSWMLDARQHPDIIEPTAMSLATTNNEGDVSCRIVLLKEYSSSGFTFFTNHGTSRKSRDIESNPKAALCFYWPQLNRQVRIEGTVERVSDEQADMYFASRIRGSQIGAWASAQSEELTDRATLEERLNALEQKYAGRDIPRPPHWHGWNVMPHSIEFWEQRDFRLHDRFLYEKRDDGEWEIIRLNP